MAATSNNSKTEGTQAENGIYDASGLEVIKQISAATFQIAGYTGSGTDDVAVQNYLQGENTLSGPGGGAYAQYNTTGFTGATSCPTPTAG